MGIALKTLMTAIFAIVLLCPVTVFAQSFGLGFGLGLPLMDYITDTTDREYRITPEPGYYPVLKTLENSYGSVHFNASLLLDMDLPVDVEVRFDMARMRWRTSKITHVTCSPVDVVNGAFNDAAADYIPISDVESTCLNRNTYQASTDISNVNMSSLWFFHISGGGRYAFYRTEEWQIFAGAHLGLTISTFDGNTWFGGNVDALFGVMVRLSDLVWLELDARILFLLTQAPDDTQTRINHKTQTGGNIFTSLVQANAYADIQISIRFDFSAL